MNELRPWSEEGATDEEQEFVNAARRERPNARARVRTLQALGLGAVLTTASTATGAAASGISGLVKGAAIGAFLGGLTVGAVAWHESRLSANPQIQAIPAPVSSGLVAEPPSPPAASTEAPLAETPNVAPTATASIPRVEHSARPAPRERPASSLSDELAALEHAHELATRDPSAALRELDRYHALYPNGALAAEETVLRVQALLARGDDDKARALSEAFSATHPDSPYARRMSDLVRAKKE